MRKIIDTHLHTWSLDKFDYYWLKNETSILNRNYELAEIEPQIEKAGVTAAILVQATNQITESNWLLQLSERYSWVLGAVVWLPLTQPHEVERLLKVYKADPFFKGVRHQIHDEQNPKWLLQTPVLESLHLLAENHIPYDLVGINHHHIDTAIKVAEKVTDLRVVFDHLNQLPVGNDMPYKIWSELLAEASKHPNFYAKLSGMGTAINKGSTWNARDIEPYLQFIFNCFGTDKVFCGGDWPVSLLAGSYEYTWLQYQKVIGTLISTEQQEQVFHKNAEHFYQVKHF